MIWTHTENQQGITNEPAGLFLYKAFFSKGREEIKTMANTMELEINGTVYAFKAGFAFIREAEPIRKQKQNAYVQNKCAQS